VFGNKPPLILCIEDDLTSLRVRKAMLEHEGYHVIGVTTAEEAMRALRENPICLTISDHMLSGTTGTQLAARMRKIKPKVPIMLYSGEMPDSLRDVDVFIGKDEPTTKFLSAVRDVLERYLG
jgi:CheY-like chemotaxis protein